MTSNDSTATFLPFSSIKFYLVSDTHFDIRDFLLEFETQRQRIAASYWSTSIYLRFNNKILSRNMDSQCPNGKFLPAFLIFLSKSLMAKASAFSTNNFLFSKISAMLGNWRMISWTHTHDSCENSNRCSHKRIFKLVPAQGALLWGKWGQRPKPRFPHLAVDAEPCREEGATYAHSHKDDSGLAGSWWKHF